jgi:hypothetical protein
MLCNDCGSTKNHTLYTEEGSNFHRCPPCFTIWKLKQNTPDDLEWVANLSDEALELLVIRLENAKRRAEGESK